MKQSQTKVLQQRPDYGIDAPAVMRNLFLAGTLLLFIGPVARSWFVSLSSSIQRERTRKGTDTMAKAGAKTTNATNPELDETRRQLIALLNGGQAHVTFDDAVAAFPAELRGKVPEGLPYSAWQLLEHLRITQRDILNFSAPPTGGYHPIQWPDDYWPKSVEPPAPHAWDHSIAAIHADLKLFIALLENPVSDFFKPFRWGDGQNLLREALLVADHTAYHLGELIILRRLLGAWQK